MLIAVTALDVGINAVQHIADSQEIHNLAVFKQPVFQLLGNRLAVDLLFSGQQQQG